MPEHGGGHEVSKAKEGGPSKLEKLLLALGLESVADLFRPLTRKEKVVLSMSTVMFVVGGAGFYEAMFAGIAGSEMTEGILEMQGGGHGGGHKKSGHGGGEHKKGGRH